ncbi:ankyrin repeat-containing protein ITN1-like [Senna tora]|uniref:Ankyrin repeat-containing protein ITN1-like n=1 Tax=Senna tora TaxID=362788 RepID=A0A834WQI6_9FABA|nr:ankyrin repeat-containing protein ITN1-like [Senna tora]
MDEREEVESYNYDTTHHHYHHEELPKFDFKMEEPQIASLEKDWDRFKSFFRTNPEALMEPFDLSGNTPIHAAVRSHDLALVKDLLDTIPDRDGDRWRALRKGNAHRNTVLHHVIHCKRVEMVDMLLEYEKDVKVPPEEHHRNNPPLLELGNDLGETPIYRAAKYGKLQILKHMAKHVDNIHQHFYRRVPDTIADRTSIFHMAIIGQFFDVAVWLTGVEGFEELAHATDKNGLTSLQLLSRMPSVFRSSCPKMGLFDKLIYAHLPDKGYKDGDDEDDEKYYRTQDIENAKRILNKPTSSVLSRINYGIWKIIAEEWDNIEEIWERKKKHKLVEEIAEVLVKQDNSWLDTYHAKPRTEVVLPVIQPCMRNPGKGRAKALEKSKTMEPIRSSVYTPLLLAGSTGIVEIAKRIIELHPEAIAHVSHDEQNVLHVAVKHRQMKIYKLIKKYGALKRLACQMSNKGRTLLHQVARMDYYDGGHQAGVVFQLQEELRWFHRVKKRIPLAFALYCNDDNLMARELFELEHADMLREAQEWIKSTAQSCSAVAVLVATVVFAAAYTVPGGTDNGVPVFLNSPLFLFFTITDVVALASSLVSVMMFLSILTSPFQMQEFYKSLPRKLTLGFALLFLSLTTTMLAFGSTILLTIRLENKRWSSSLIYSVMFFPVTLFGLTQYPIVMAVKYRMKRVWKALKKIVPRGIVKSTKAHAHKKRIYSKYS